MMDRGDDHNQEAGVLLSARAAKWLKLHPGFRCDEELEIRFLEAPNRARSFDNSMDDQLKASPDSPLHASSLPETRARPPFVATASQI